MTSLQSAYLRLQSKQEITMDESHDTTAISISMSAVKTGAVSYTHLTLPTRR